MKEIFTIRRSEVKNDLVWELMCFQLDVPASSKRIVIEYVRAGASEDTLKEVEQ